MQLQQKQWNRLDQEVQAWSGSASCVLLVRLLRQRLSPAPAALSRWATTSRYCLSENKFFSNAFSLQALIPFVEPSAKPNMVGGHGPHAVAGNFAAANDMAAATATATAGSTWVLEVRCEKNGPVFQQVHTLTGMPAPHCLC